ncbi:helix-turn-helix domain-containing protein [Alkalicoccus chagannorensis]|uniref:helix-turn-helix domain-containing protein n=1 Tax=Alkalicoccus chagannorensis TaxID=427072 RepID=UPI000479323E|nr:helix-turn-helix transcriptional regulator [Alkalicoccus chagannorensis]
MVNSLSKDFGLNVYNRRLELGMSQEDLAGITEIDRTTIVRIEHGKANSKISTIQALASGLRILPKDLLDTD